MKKPKAENPDLQDLIEELWNNAPNAIGDGSMADAIRYERKTGKPVKERFHSKKARNLITALEKWLRSKTKPKPASDKKIAREIIRDLKDALSGDDYDQ